ncbi:nucleolin-like isoform X2 [Actinia tenebrosa]|uniref:Nucleolin-like isoform X2 n=1 Tax=Actinia tenebrosa TaxID=6105 RepID=A0A6P8ING4_ACTTE|nr:nucleolin-like isoform X2 [Actinia tenebrosa]
MKVFRVICITPCRIITENVVRRLTWQNFTVTDKPNKPVRFAAACQVKHPTFMDQNRKGTRKDTPAHVQMPSPFRRQVRNMPLETKLEEEEKDCQNEVIIKENHDNQSVPRSKETGQTQRTRKPTPAYVQRQVSKKGKQKSVSFDEELLEEEEDEAKQKLTGDFIDIAKHPILRKDTPAVLTNPKSKTKARTLSNQGSITEEEENEDDFDETLMKKSA